MITQAIPSYDLRKILLNFAFILEFVPILTEFLLDKNKLQSGYLFGIHVQIL